MLAEREHVVTSALSVTVHTAGDLDPVDEPLTFGTVIRERLAKLDVHGERWASWKDEERGWIVKLEFTADTIDHDAAGASTSVGAPCSPSIPRRSRSRSRASSKTD